MKHVRRSPRRVNVFIPWPYACPCNLYHLAIYQSDRILLVRFARSPPALALLSSTSAHARKGRYSGYEDGNKNHLLTALASLRGRQILSLYEFSPQRFPWSLDMWQITNRRRAFQRLPGPCNPAVYPTSWAPSYADTQPSRCRASDISISRSFLSCPSTTGGLPFLNTILCSASESICSTVGGASACHPIRFPAALDDLGKNNSPSRYESS